jgi:hypothetical protein
LEQGPTKRDHEDLDTAIDDRGIIPNFKSYHKSAPYNPGKFFQNHLHRLPKDATRLFCTPKILGTKLHDPTTTDLYTLEPCGKNTINTMVNKISAALGVGNFTNHDLRSTSIVAMRRSNVLKLHDIRKITGHKSDKTIEECYNPGMSSSKRADAALAILQSSRFSRDEKFQPVSSHLKVKDPGNSQYYTPVEELFLPVVTELPEADFDLGTHFENFDTSDFQNQNLKRKSTDDQKDSNNKVRNPALVNVVQSLKSVNIDQIALTGFNKKQQDLVHFPLTVIDNDPELGSASVLFARCTKNIDDDETDVVSHSDGDVPVPTLKTLKAKAKGKTILNATILLEWKKTGIMPDFKEEKYQVDSKPVKLLFQGMSFCTFVSEEFGFKEKDIISLILDCGGKFVGRLESLPSDLDENIILLSDKQPDVNNEILCPSFITACLSKDKLVEKEPFLYKTKSLPTTSPLMKSKLCVKPLAPQPQHPARVPNMSIDLPPPSMKPASTMSAMQEAHVPPSLTPSPDVHKPAMINTAVPYPAMTYPATSFSGSPHPGLLYSGFIHPSMMHPAMSYPGLTMANPAMSYPGLTMAHPTMANPGMTMPHPAISHPGMTMAHPAMSPHGMTMAHPGMTMAHSGMTVAHPAMSHPGMTQPSPFYHGHYNNPGMMQLPIPGYAAQDCGYETNPLVGPTHPPVQPQNNVLNHTAYHLHYQASLASPAVKQPSSDQKIGITLKRNKKSSSGWSLKE